MSALKIKILINLIIISTSVINPINGFGMKLMKVPDDDRSQVICTVALLRKYFHSGESLSGLVLSMSITPASPHIQRNLLEAIHKSSDYPWSVVIKAAQGIIPTSGFVLHEKPQCYFIIVENLEDVDLEYIFEDWKTTVNWNPLAQFVVYMATTEKTDEEMSELMNEILLSFMNKKMFNVNVIGQNEDNGFYYGKTVFPYHPDNNCGTRVITIETLDVCDYRDEEADDNNNDYDDGDVEVGEAFKQYDTYDEKIFTDFAESENETEPLFDPDYQLSDFTEEIKRFRRAPVSNYKYVETVSYQSSKDMINAAAVRKYYLEELYRALFLDKFPKDLSGCPLVAAFRPWEPYIFNEDTAEAYNYEDDDNIWVGNLEEEINTISVRGLNGIEYKMIQTIAERLHINIDLQVEDRNLYHLFQQLIDGDIEMIVGGIDEDPSISQFVSSTIPYHQDDLTWCVAKAQRKHNLYNFLENFDPATWAFTFISLLTIALNITIAQRVLNITLNHLEGWSSVAFRMLGVILNQSVPLQSIPTSFKLLFGSMFLLGFMFTNVYQSVLVSTLTTPKSSYQISHLEEIYNQRMDIMGKVENVRHLNKEGEIFRYIRKKFQMCYSIETCLQRAASDDHVAVAVSREHSFYNPRIPRDNLYCFNREENLYVYLVTMLLPKKFHLLHKINPVIQHIIESGHMQKWARDLDMKRKIYEEIHRTREEPFKRLTMAQVGGTFTFSTLSLMSSGVVLLLERWVYAMVTQRKTRLKIVKKLHIQFM